MASSTKRYRAGQLPEYAREEKKEDAFSHLSKAASQPQPRRPAPAVIEKDARLSRLERLNAASDDVEERIQRHRQIVHAAESNAGEEDVKESPAERRRRAVQDAEIISPGDSNAIEEALDSRAERLRRAQQLREEEDAGELPVAEDDEDDIGMSEEEEDDEDEEDWNALAPSRPLVMPKFVAKERRDTVAEKQKEEEEEKKRIAMEEKMALERKERTRQLLRDQIARDQQQLDKPGEVVEAASDDEVEGVVEDSDDETFQQREYEKWKLRELQRIRRDREERDAIIKEREDAERRRLMSDAEVLAEKAKDGLLEKEKKTMKFMQKYWHKGAFYQDDIKPLEEKHDWVAPTGEDTFVDKSLLPKVLQVKNFGKSGRTKYTHLVDQDTSRPDDPWALAHAVALGAKYNVSSGPISGAGMPSGAAIIAKQKERMGGFGDFERPSKKQKTSHQ